MRHIYESNLFADAVSEGNIWAFPYTPCSYDHLVDYLNVKTVWNALHVDMEWMESSNTANGVAAWSMCARPGLQYDVNGTDKAEDQVLLLTGNYIFVSLLQSTNLLSWLMAGPIRKERVIGRNSSFSMERE